MIRIAWKQILRFGFILFLLLSGCAERQPTVEELVGQAEDLLNVGQIDGAIVLLERGLEQEPNRVDLLEPLAFAYAADQDPMLAAMTFMRIAELVPEQAEYLIYAAESLIEGGDTEGAVAPYREYLKVRPTDRPVWITLAEMHRSSGRTGEALEAYLAAEQLEAKASQQVLIGSLYLQSQNLAQAQAWFARALEGDAEARDEALLGLLETAVRSKRFQEAEALLTQLEAEYPGRIDQSSLTDVREQLEEWKRRRDAARAALAELNARKAEEAREPSPEPVEEQPAAVEEAPAQPVAEMPVAGEEQPVALAVEEPARPVPTDYVGQGRQSRSSGDLDGAIRHFKQALIGNDNQPAIWAELSALYLETGRDRWAQATASEAMRRDPATPEYALQFLRAAQKTMDAKRLVREMETIYRKFPDSPDLILFMARVFADQGNTRNAEILFQKFLKLVPADHPERSSAEMDLSFLNG
ncbi:MAG: tetratricopeptide repeat protein [Opitutales bacterium]|jgi:tetratricopeptide (TPR) repeat protein